MSKMVGRAIAVASTVLVLGLIGVSAYRKNAALRSAASSSGENATPVSLNSPVPALNMVSLIDNGFSPATITIKKGTAVTWTNTDATDHAVIADQPSNDAPLSQAFSLGQSYVFTFPTPGTYAYHCRFHQNMTGTVIVTP
jgi:plastocyanin